MKKNSLFWVLAGTVVCCAAMALVDGVIRPSYWLKSAIKIALFLGVPLLLTVFFRQLEFRSLFRFQKRGFFVALGLGAALYGVILIAYHIAARFFDFSAIVSSLSENAGVHKENFLFVSLYISFINSLLEEFFFRGFLFANLKKLTTRQFAYLFSAAAFALYHAAMLTGWFSPALYILVMAGLMAGGMIFNFLNEKQGNICTSWLVHMCVNFAINTIGFRLMA